MEGLADLQVPQRREQAELCGNGPSNIIAVQISARKWVSQTHFNELRKKKQKEQHVQVSQQREQAELRGNGSREVIVIQVPVHKPFKAMSKKENGVEGWHLQVSQRSQTELCSNSPRKTALDDIEGDHLAT